MRRGRLVRRLGGAVVLGDYAQGRWGRGDFSFLELYSILAFDGVRRECCIAGDTTSTAR